MGMDDRELAQQWMKIAEQDLAIAELAIREDPPLIYPGLFHSQQAAEKALKAVLTREGILPPRTHDLRALWTLAAKIAGWKEPPADLGQLTDYAVEPRYPTPERAYRMEEAQRAVASARAVVAAVKEIL